LTDDTPSFQTTQEPRHPQFLNKIDASETHTQPDTQRGQGCSRAWTEVDGVHSLLCTK